jgi:acetoin utilization deacetylase AcuC-like enzyme
MLPRSRWDCRSTFLFSPRYLDYDLGPGHPLRPARLAALLELVEDLSLLEGPTIRVREPEPATERELELAHARAYIAAVKALGAGAREIDPNPLGLGPGDTPAFPGMHEAAATIAGGTLAAARQVMGGATAHAFNPGGGLHHAQRDRASGFCIYNDLVVAIADAVQETDARVLYVDFDVHHGDGVQAAFYDDPRVLTVSFHETGRYLFPGTGDVPEFGTGAGVGFSVNVPLAAFTEDASWLESVESLLPALAERFRPDLIVSQHGCDGHVWDGQSHLLLTLRAYQRSARLVHRIAHEQCAGRWVAAGGGGYDPVRVVPRAWASVWAEMAQGRVPGRIPSAWLRRWQPSAEGLLPPRMADPPEIVPEIPRRPQIEIENRHTVARVRDMALSLRLRQAYRPAGVWTPHAVAAFPEGRARRVELDRRPLILRERAPVSLLRRLRVAKDMHAFTRDAAREGALLRLIAGRPEANLTIAYTPEGEIVAEATLAPAEGRWIDMDGVYEIAVQVAPSWRRTGLAGTLVRFVTEPEYVEDLILIALGVSWHWDLAGTALNPYAYRDVLVRTFGAGGFRPYATDDPDITAGEGNVLLARIGRRVTPEADEEFDRRLNRRRSWLGF